MKRFIVEKYGDKYFVKIKIGLFKWAYIRYGDERYPNYFPFDSYEKAVDGAKSWIEDYGFFGLKWNIRKELKHI